MALPAPFALVARQGRLAVRAVGQSVLAYVAILVLAITGTGFLLGAAYLWLARLSDPVLAALIMGAILLGIALIWVTVLLIRARQRRRRNRTAAVNTAMMASSLSLANTGLQILSRSKRSIVVPAVALAAAWFFLRPGGGDDSEDYE